MKKLLAGIGAIVLLGAGCSSEKTAQNSVPNTTASTVASYTLADVALANNESKCWTAINNKVYDLTGALNKHPGGKPALLQLCGKEGTTSFEKQHGTNEKARGMLQGLEIGVLK